LIYPTQHYQNGGIETSVSGETNIPNLYVAGEVAGGVHGHNRLGSNSLVDIFVFGRRAGIDMARKVKKIKTGRLTLGHVKTYNESILKKEKSFISSSPILLPDYRFEKALTTVQHIKRH
jgi:succinate dehydrogenase / fumarate reductase flavoprotein subunit